jgi:hypothetical protein
MCVALLSQAIHHAPLTSRLPRSNMRRQLGFFGLLLYDLKTWIHLQRTQRRDPVPVWRKHIKRIEGSFGTGPASFFVFLR